MKRKITEPAIENPKSKIRNRNWLAILIISVVALGVFGTGMSFLEQSAKDERLARKNQNYKPSLFGRQSLPADADAGSVALEGTNLRWPKTVGR
ncbi:MAG: hypothetical protein IPJ30_10630 [Acidobacteria bacterium]|nr:hypothetical protein [Acidobacteriota bacterium]